MGNFYLFLKPIPPYIGVINATVSIHITIIVLWLTEGVEWQVKQSIWVYHQPLLSLISLCNVLCLYPPQHWVHFIHANAFIQMCMVPQPKHAAALYLPYLCPMVLQSTVNIYAIADHNSSLTIWLSFGDALTGISTYHLAINAYIAGCKTACSLSFFVCWTFLSLFRTLMWDPSLEW